MLRTFKVKARDFDTEVEISLRVKTDGTLTAHEAKNVITQYEDRIFEHVLLPSFNVRNIKVVK